MKNLLYLITITLITVLSVNILFSQYTVVEYRVQELKTIFFNLDENSGEPREQILDLNTNKHLQKPPRYITMVIEDNRSYESEKKNHRLCKESCCYY